MRDLSDVQLHLVESWSGLGEYHIRYKRRIGRDCGAITSIKTFAMRRVQMRHKPTLMRSDDGDSLMVLGFKKEVLL